MYNPFPHPTWKKSFNLRWRFALNQIRQHIVSGAAYEMDDAKEYLLANDDETCSNEGVVIYRSRPQSNWLSRHKYVFVIIWASLFLPLVLNAYLLYRNLERQEQPKIKGVGRSPYGRHCNWP